MAIRSSMATIYHNSGDRVSNVVTEQETRTMHDTLVLDEIHKVQRGEITPVAATDTIMGWCEEEVNNSDDWREIMEEERIHKSWTTGAPDLFSDEMRNFWNA